MHNECGALCEMRLWSKTTTYKWYNYFQSGKTAKGDRMLGRHSASCEEAEAEISIGSCHNIYRRFRMHQISAKSLARLLTDRVSEFDVLQQVYDANLFLNTPLLEMGLGFMGVSLKQNELSLWKSAALTSAPQTTL
jgi:hypothetical protein